MLSKAFLYIPLFTISTIAFAQNGDSLNAVSNGITAKSIRYMSGDLTQLTIANLQPIDTSLQDFENYNILYQKNGQYASTGNFGGPAYNLRFEPLTAVGIDPGYQTQFPHFLQSNTLKYYRSPSPFTELSYVNAQLKEQLLKVIHTQNVSKRWSVGINFDRIDAIGYYKRQKLNYLGFAAFTWYQSKDTRYNAYANFIVNRQRWEENGGVSNRNLFEKEQTQDHLIEDVNLAFAQNKVKSFQVNCIQTYDFGRKDSVKVKDKNYLQFIPSTRITYQVGAARNQSIYTDSQPFISDYTALYNFGVDTTNVRDSFQVNVFTQQLTVSSIKPSDSVRKYIEYSFALNQQMAVVTNADPTQKNVLGNYGYDLFLQYNISRSIGLMARTKLASNDNNSTESMNSIGWILKKQQHRLVLDYSQTTNHPDFFFNRNFAVFQTFKNINTEQQTAAYKFQYHANRWNLGIIATQYHIKNYQYWYRASAAQPINPVFLMSPTTINQLQVYKNFRITHFGLDNHLVFQQSNVQQQLNLPKWYTSQSIYYIGQWFKVLHIKLGFDVRYNSSFNMPSYSGIARVFYTEASINQSIAYPIVDVFAAARIKKARIFIKLDHLNQGLWGNRGYFTVTGYPMPDRVIKFGISWKFYD